MKSKINSPKAITLSIGILFAPAITFRLNGTYWNKDQKYSGEYTISKEGKNLILHSSSGSCTPLRTILPVNFFILI